MRKPCLPSVHAHPSEAKPGVTVVFIVQSSDEYGPVRIWGNEKSAYCSREPVGFPPERNGGELMLRPGCFHLPAFELQREHKTASRIVKIERYGTGIGKLNLFFDPGGPWIHGETVLDGQANIRLPMKDDRRAVLLRFRENAAFRRNTSRSRQPEPCPWEDGPACTEVRCRA